VGPRHSRWTRAAATLAGGGLLALVATWLPVSLAGTTSAIAAGQHSVQITAMGAGCTNFYCFGPATVAAASGDTVTWTNGTTAYHTITRCDASACAGQGPGTGGDALSSPTLFGSGSFSHAFSAGGTYLYYCTVHGYAVMHGEVDVSGGPPPPPPPTPRPTPRPTPKPTPRPTPAPTQRMTTPSSAPAVAATHTPPATATAATSGTSPSPLAITLPSGAPTISSGPSSASAFSTTPVAAAGTTSGGPPVVPVVVALLAIAGLAGAGYRLWRRRSPTA
jgi:plastocyanin